MNNERWGDKQVGGSESYLEDHPDKGDDADQSPRNATYAKNLASVGKLVAIRFRCVRPCSSTPSSCTVHDAPSISRSRIADSLSEDKTIDPPTSAIFSLVNQTDLTPIALDRLPLYRKDYIGLRALDKRGALDRDGVCIGEHMQIVRCEGLRLPLTGQDEDCWTMVLDHLAPTKKQSSGLLVQAGSRA